MPEKKCHEDRVAELIVEAAFAVHTKLGPGLLESVYVAALVLELTRTGLKVEKEVPVRAIYDGVDLGLGYRCDLLVENAVVIEVKSVRGLEDVLMKQCLTYIKLLNRRLGLVVNFGGQLLKNNIRRVANGMPE